jgi:hypothetical protein
MQLIKLIRARPYNLLSYNTCEDWGRGPAEKILQRMLYKGDRIARVRQTKKINFACSECPGQNEEGYIKMFEEFLRKHSQHFSFKSFVDSHKFIVN